MGLLVTVIVGVLACAVTVAAFLWGLSRPPR